MEDDRIVELFCARDEEALSASKAKYGAYCFAIAERILGDREDAEEVESDVFLKAWDSIPPQRPLSLKTHLGTIARRTALDRYDSRKTQKRGGGQTQAAFDELAEVLSGADSGDGFADSIALKDALNGFLASLPKKARVIFLQRYWYFRDTKEIAREFSMKENSVHVLLARTREKLKKHLEKEGFTV